MKNQIFPISIGAVVLTVASILTSTAKKKYIQINPTYASYFVTIRASTFHSFNTVKSLGGIVYFKTSGGRTITLKSDRPVSAPVVYYH